MNQLVCDILYLWEPLALMLHIKSIQVPQKRQLWSFFLAKQRRMLLDFNDSFLSGVKINSWEVDSRKFNGGNVEWTIRCCMVNIKLFFSHNKQWNWCKVTQSVEYDTIIFTFFLWRKKEARSRYFDCHFEYFVNYPTTAINKYNSLR